MINFSKKERKIFMQLLASYKEATKYGINAMYVSCLQSYFDYKLKQNSINPKPCAIRDYDGEIVANDYPPDYGLFTADLLKVVEEFDMYDDLDVFSNTVLRIFKWYTKQFYTEKQVEFFDDYSITAVLEKSKIKYEWRQKQDKLDSCKKKFFELAVCKEVLKEME